MDVDRTFVGRARELELLTARLVDARGGRGQLVLVSGEPGIGKTRLAGELGRHAESYVQHILGKLSLANRTHIAAWAREGLRTDLP